LNHGSNFGWLVRIGLPRAIEARQIGQMRSVRIGIECGNVLPPIDPISLSAVEGM
jgi:hypothetical protein